MQIKIQKGGESMSSTAQTAQHNVEKPAGLKILECTVVEDANLRPSRYSYLACGSGGGCGSWGSNRNRAAQARRMQRTL